ncbi:MAG: hypothetical protein ACTH0V_16115 [Microbacteriaceae bacterium]
MNNREHAPRRPSRPKKSVRALLPVFLAAIGSHREPTPDTQRLYHDAIIATGQRPGTLRWRSIVHVISNAPGSLPPDNLTEAAQQYIDRKLGRRDRALAAADESAETAVAFITEVRERTGAGPTWTELTRACGVPATSTEWFVTRLHTNGIVTSTSEQRSLRVKIHDDEPAG